VRLSCGVSKGRTREWPIPDRAATSRLVQQTVAVVVNGEEPEASTDGLVRDKTLLGFSEETSLFRPGNWRLLRGLVLEMLGRSLFTTVLVADLFMRVNQVVWSCGRQLATSPQLNTSDRLMSLIDRPAEKDREAIRAANS
jgi:hypothetical protein